MDLNSTENRNKLICYFPKLNSDPHFKITSENTTDYNCIAWAMGFDDRWVEPPSPHKPSDGRSVWWPVNARSDMSYEALISAFQEVGFKICTETNVHEGYDVVVLYGDGGIWTHASRIISLNEEHSKFGESWDGIHGRQMFDGTSYGNPYAYMKRPAEERDYWINKFPLPKPTIMPNIDLLAELAKKMGLIS